MKLNSNLNSSVQVQLPDRAYQILVQSGLLSVADEMLQTHVSGEHVVVVTDDTVGPIYLEPFCTAIDKVADRVDTITIKTGESSKSVKVLDGLWQHLVDNGTDRKSIVIALGGGVVGDLAGFLAASFARGIRFIQVPTSLLAQVDSSVGGKVGINLPTAKNMVGAFWQPETVLIDPSVLQTLDERNYRAGMAEVIKYGVIMDPALFDYIEANVDSIHEREPIVLTSIITRCCQCKADVVEEDEKETTGRRVILNYGHTYGHAIEAVYGYGEFLHGEAISIGMTCAARLARNLGMIDQAMLTRQSELFHRIGLPTKCPEDRLQQLVDSMKSDKKVTRGELKLILPDRMGNVIQVPAPADEVIIESMKEA